MSIDYFCFSDFNLPIAEKTNESLLNNYLFKEKIFILYSMRFNDLNNFENYYYSVEFCGCYEFWWIL